MTMVSLQATARTAKATAKVIRKASKVPCVLYGNDTENVSLECDYSELFRCYVKAGASTLVELDAAGKKVPVLFHDLEFDPVSDRITHVDFYAVDMKKEIEASVPVRFEGEAPAVKELGGIFVTTLDHVTVKCLPTDLPPELVVNIESLVDFGNTLPVSEVSVPDKVVIQQSPETVLATVQEPRKEEVIEEKPTEEGEGAEGAEGETAAAEGAEGDKPAEEGGEEAKAKED